MREGSLAQYPTFVKRLVKQSTASEYAYARNEWVPVRYWVVKHPIKCLCGAPITKVLLVKNVFNGHEEWVGVRCAKELILNVLGERALNDFDTLAINPDLIPNPALAIFGFLDEYISEKEYHFLIDMSRREWATSTPNQKQWLRQVNKKMVAKIPRSVLEKVFWPHYTIYR